MKEEEKESWEKEFDGLFFPEIGSTKTELQRHSARKDFIRDLLTSQRAELLEKIEKFSEGIGCEKNPRWVLSEVKKIIGGSDE